jgi:hypothetical protein
MRILKHDELALVAGGGSSCGEVCFPDEGKNNNGYGNGAESGPPPGNSGAHNPQLIGPNEGPRGPR